MTAKVFFADMRTDIKTNMLDKTAKICNLIGITNQIEKGFIVAVKLHFGEPGNTSSLRSVYARKVVEVIKSTGAKPFLTDTCTLYRGARDTAPSHLEAAFAQGFDFASVGAPVVIADGIRSTTSIKVPVNGRHFKEVSIGAEIVNADALIVLSHFKLHEVTGFGGALKNIGMGSADREGKLSMHSTLGPNVNQDECEGCGHCVIACSFGAISLQDGKSHIDKEICVGCGECLAVCPEEAIEINWNEKAANVQTKMMEFALGALSGKKDKAFFINFIMQVSPACDCYSYSDMPIVWDIGILGSIDPVALDKACVDMVNAAPGIAKSNLKKALEPGSDKFRDIYPSIDYSVQFTYAEELGLGTTKYQLIKI